MRRTFFAFFALGFASVVLAGCQSARCDDPAPAEPPAFQVYDDPPAAVECDPCTGQCAVPQARVAAPAVVGEYGYVLGPPGAREQFGSVVAIPPKTLKCLADGAHRILVDGLDTAQCVLTSLYPVPEPSQRLVRLERVARPPALRRVVRARAQSGCGAPMPAPAPGPQPGPGEPPPSIPAAR